MTTIDSEERKKYFGWLTLEQVAQFVGFLIIGAVGYTRLSAQVETVIQRQEENRVNAEKGADAARVIAAEVRAATQTNLQQQGEINSLQQSRDNDRKLLMEIHASVAVLLDRSDPRKTNP
jgi:hypothetical protein